MKKQLIQKQGLSVGKIEVANRTLVGSQSTLLNSLLATEMELIFESILIMPDRANNHVCNGMYTTIDIWNRHFDGTFPKGRLFSDDELIPKSDSARSYSILFSSGP